MKKETIEAERKKRYRRKVISSGNIKEVEIYPVWRIRGEDGRVFDRNFDIAAGHFA